MSNFTIEIVSKKDKSVKSYTKDKRKQFGAGISTHWLNTSNPIVMLGNFTTDPLEKQFEKSGSHGTYFTSVQQFLEISWCS